MYTKQYDDVNEDWIIYCPEGIHICVVLMEEEADALLSHLNR